jgi:molecular chaperone Hsp33
MPPFAFFTGLLRVVKSLGPRQLYQGIAEVRGERFERALHRYMAESQQVDARVRVVAEAGEEGRVSFAAGLLVERLPQADPAEFAAIVDGALSIDFKELMAGFAFGQLAGAPVEVLGAQDLRFSCTCSLDRIHAMLRSLGADEIRSMLADQGQAEVTCHYCNTRYVVDESGLRSLL